MKFRISTSGLPIPNGVLPQISWEALDGDGNVVARGPRAYGSERECRSSIARARKAFQGARFAKVVTS